MQQAKDFLTKNDKMNYIIKDGEEIEFRLDTSFNKDELTPLYTKNIINSKMEGIFVVKKPDYLGNSKWELRHGKETISAKIEDSEWLKKFQGREVDVRPGDSLKCRSIVQYHYGYDNELIHEEYTIESVTEVLENTFFIHSQIMLSDKQKENFNFFEQILPEYLKDNLKINKFLIIHNKSVIGLFDTSQNALKKAIESKLPPNEFIIQQVINDSEIINFLGIAV